MALVKNAYAGHKSYMICSKCQSANLAAPTVQRSLKLKMEAQSRYFDRIADDHHRDQTATIAKPNYQPSSSISLPPLEESESNAKEFESDSDGDITQIQSEEFQALKRMKTTTQYSNVTSTPWLRESEVSYGAHDGISFPWNNTASCCPSPLMPSFF
ncbi:hypothetical protein HS088_TW13G00122 [Tripterygium wilfordii]|uniref:Uncharacterized protein n=1 Tax=Tripterygium wilfordii TaxID=458696 RepID=A0A7J7CT30_TRIWF|nr:hypothetical protein HS088_TW13G00122 [Tripterygium wilfordii]